MLYGAIIGDVLGSTYEFNNTLLPPEEIPIFPKGSHPTDDSVLTCASPALAWAMISASRFSICFPVYQAPPVQTAPRATIIPAATSVFFMSFIPK